MAQARHGIRLRLSPRHQLAGQHDVISNDPELSVGVVADLLEDVERLLLGAAVGGHDDAHRGANHACRLEASSS